MGVAILSTRFLTDLGYPFFQWEFQFQIELLSGKQGKCLPHVCSRGRGLQTPKRG